MSVTEQRYQAVLAVVGEGREVTDVAGWLLLGRFSVRCGRVRARAAVTRRRVLVLT
jgi:hypothetical protein